MKPITTAVCAHCHSALSVSMVGTPACLWCRRHAAKDARVAAAIWQAQRPQITNAPIDAGPVDQMAGVA